MVSGIAAALSWECPSGPAGAGTHSVYPGFATIDLPIEPYWRGAH
ncbi:hypothetical protein NYF14_18780 [Sphingobium sp. 10 DY56-G10]|nr:MULTISPECIES: hypothetical protein [Sphingomonadaceae]